jgi:hypothetical protein
VNCFLKCEQLMALTLKKPKNVNPLLITLRVKFGRKSNLSSILSTNYNPFLLFHSYLFPFKTFFF